MKSKPVHVCSYGDEHTFDYSCALADVIFIHMKNIRLFPVLATPVIIKKLDIGKVNTIIRTSVLTIINSNFRVISNADRSYTYTKKQDMRPTSREEVWKAHYLKLVEFKEKRGTTKVPRTVRRMLAGG